MAQNAVDRFADVRVEVDRINNLHITVLRGDLRQRVTDLLKPAPKTFAAMARHQNHFFVRREERITLG
ncbi:hypothetical protein D3C80_2028020 [compost metagenome]